MKIYGASDDLIEVEDIKGADEFGAYGSEPIRDEFIVAGSGGQLRLIAIYDGCWSFAIAPVDEDVPIPNWPVRVSLGERGYSTLLEIDTPPDATINRLAKD